MTSDPWDIVPATVNSRSEKPAETGAFQPNAEPAEIVEVGGVPVTMPAGAVANAKLDGEPVIVVGAKPNGLPVIFCPKGWRMLQRWKLDQLSVGSGRVRACGSGRSSGFVAERFLLNAPRNHVVFQRNANLLDLRLSNIVSIPQGLLRQAEIERARGADYGADVTLLDGRMRSCRKPLNPTAVERIAAIMAGGGVQP